MSPKWPNLCRVARKTLTQSIDQSTWRMLIKIHKDITAFGSVIMYFINLTVMFHVHLGQPQVS